MRKFSLVEELAVAELRRLAAVTPESGVAKTLDSLGEQGGCNAILPIRVALVLKRSVSISGIQKTGWHAGFGIHERNLA
jgi:hypothetical protein